MLHGTVEPCDFLPLFPIGAGCLYAQLHHTDQVVRHMFCIWDSVLNPCEYFSLFALFSESKEGSAMSPASPLTLVSTLHPDHVRVALILIHISITCYWRYTLSKKNT